MVKIVFNYLISNMKSPKEQNNYEGIMNQFE